MKCCYIVSRVTCGFRSHPPHYLKDCLQHTLADPRIIYLCSIGMYFLVCGWLYSRFLNFCTLPGHFSRKWYFDLSQVKYRVGTNFIPLNTMKIDRLHIPHLLTYQ